MHLEVVDSKLHFYTGIQGSLPGFHLGPKRLVQFKRLGTFDREKKKKVKGPSAIEVKLKKKIIE